MGKLKAVKRGDLVVVSWFDILLDPGGNPADANLSPAENIGFFHGVGQKSGVWTLTLALERRANSEEFSTKEGFVCIPLACIKAMHTLQVANEVAIPRRKEGTPS
jgi:hypothetical protein